MKKALISVLLLSLLALSACGSPSQPAQSDVPASSPPATVPDVSTPAPSSPAPAATSPSANPFDAFKTALDDAGYSYEVVTMGAELVGASRGEKYKFDFGTVELYQFDDDSDVLSKAIEDGGLTLEGFGVFPCEFNGSLAAIIDVTENEDALLGLFNSL